MDQKIQRKKIQILSIRNKEGITLQILQPFLKREYFEYYDNKLKNLNRQIERTYSALKQIKIKILSWPKNSLGVFWKTL